MKRIAVLASIALSSLIGCADDRPVDRTAQPPSPPAQTATETVRAPEMSEADRTLAQQVETALRQNSALAPAAENVQVSVRNGEVTLRGSVNNAQEKVNLGSAAGQVAGVSKVNNQIEVSSASR
jgi:osmotically-inducible protein OsmY